jgi:hypothetical protein
MIQEPKKDGMDLTSGKTGDPEIDEKLEEYDEEQILYVLVKKETRKFRLAMCRACPDFRKVIQQCKICGCFMPLKTSLLYDPVTSAQNLRKTKTECPKGLW